jgi:hypothetical protein
MYAPRPIPAGPDMVRAINDEFQSIAQQWAQTVPYLQLSVAYVAPTKPRDGMVVVFDSTVPEATGGAGVYARISGAWVKL